jgi:hypothetical protein
VGADHGHGETAMSFPEPVQFNGADDRPMRRSNGEPQPWKCLACPAAGRGYVSRAKHYYQSEGHHIVAADDPRAKDAPRESRDPQPETECLAEDGQGRR